MWVSCSNIDLIDSCLNSLLLLYADNCFRFCNCLLGLGFGYLVCVLLSVHVLRVWLEFRVTLLLCLFGWVFVTVTP